MGLNHGGGNHDRRLGSPVHEGLGPCSSQPGLSGPEEDPWGFHTALSKQLLIKERFLAERALRAAGGEGGAGLRAG